MSEIEGTYETADGTSMHVALADEPTFERLREALGDPVWLLGATWTILTTNDYKRGRFHDAFGAWMATKSDDDARTVLDTAGAGVT